jgi:hypothetical protein
MKTPFLIALAGLAAAGLAAVTTPASAADWMSAPDVKRELLGTELAFRGRFFGRIIYRADGRMRMVAANGEQVFGEWRIDEASGSLCSQFYTRRKGKESCFRTRHDGLGYLTDQGYKLMPLGF